MWTKNEILRYKAFPYIPHACLFCTPCFVSDPFFTGYWFANQRIATLQRSLCGRNNWSKLDAPGGTLCYKYGVPPPPSPQITKVTHRNIPFYLRRGRGFGFAIDSPIADCVWWLAEPPRFHPRYQRGGQPTFVPHSIHIIIKLTLFSAKLSVRRPQLLRSADTLQRLRQKRGTYWVCKSFILNLLINDVLTNS